MGVFHESEFLRVPFIGNCFSGLLVHLGYDSDALADARDGSADSRRRLDDVLQELQGARRTLEREGQKLRDACSHLSTAEAVGKPEMKTALKVISFLQEHTVKFGSTSVCHISMHPHPFLHSGMICSHSVIAVMCNSL